MDSCYQVHDPVLNVTLAINLRDKKNKTITHGRNNKEMNNHLKKKGTVKNSSNTMA